jgi:hypothetical protein
MKNTRISSRTARAVATAGAVFIAAALAGCGGGGGGGGGGFYPFPVGANPPPGGQPPAELSAYDAFVAYIVALVATQNEDQDAANVAQFDPPPTSETKEPVATP